MEVYGAMVVFQVTSSGQRFYTNLEAKDASLNVDQL